MPGFRLQFLAATGLGVVTAFVTAWAGVLLPIRADMQQADVRRPPREYRERRTAAGNPWTVETRSEIYRTTESWGSQTFELLTRSPFGFRGRDIPRLFERLNEAVDEQSPLAHPEHGSWFLENGPDAEARITRWALLEAGVPYRAFRAVAWTTEGGASGVKGGLVLGRSSNDSSDDAPETIIPITPNWIAFTANTGVWMTLWAGVLYARTAIRQARALPLNAEPAVESA